MPSSAAHRHQRVDDHVDQRRIDAGGRLVEQAEPRPRHQDAAEIDELALPAGEIADIFVADAASGRAAPSTSRARARFARSTLQHARQPQHAPRAGSAPSGPAPPRAGSRWRSSRCPPSECWKVRMRPSPAMACGGSPWIGAPREEDRPAVAPLEAGDDVEERALARAVRADQPDDAALPDEEAHILQRLAAPQRISKRPRLRAWRISPPRRSGASGRTSDAALLRGQARASSASFEQPKQETLHAGPLLSTLCLQPLAAEPALRLGAGGVACFRVRIHAVHVSAGRKTRREKP